VDYLYKDFPLLRSKTTSAAYLPIKILSLWDYSEERLRPNLNTRNTEALEDVPQIS